MGNDVYASAVGPTDMNPNAVVETTSADRRALDNSARLETFDFGGGGDKDVVVESLSLFVASLESTDSEAAVSFIELFSSSFEVFEVEKNELCFVIGHR